MDRVISYLFVRSETLRSSRLEGTWSTIDDILSPASILDPTQAKSNSLSIRGYAEAMERNFKLIKEKKHEAFTLGLLRDIHKTIMSKDPSYQGKPGNIRKSGRLAALFKLEVLVA